MKVKQVEAQTAEIKEQKRRKHLPAAANVRATKEKQRRARSNTSLERMREEFVVDSR